jgi:hypothetical protein
MVATSTVMAMIAYITATMTRIPVAPAVSKIAPATSGTRLAPIRATTTAAAGAEGPDPGRVLLRL